MKTINSKSILTIVSVILLFVLMYFSVEIIKSGKEVKAYKSDYAELHSVKYGMFNSDQWTSKITKIIGKKIDNYDINIDNRDEVEGYVSTIIDTIIVEAERIIKDRNKGGTTFLENVLSSTKQIITDSIIDFKELRSHVPEFAATVMTEIEKPENQARAKKVLREKFKEFMQNKFEATTDLTDYNALLKKYHAKNVQECTVTLNSHIKNHIEEMNSISIKILLIALFIILIIIFQGTLSSMGLFTLAGTTLSLLVTGIMLPMLDIEVKITKLYFVLLENPIVFENQILFFQSKSISDLLILLIKSAETKMIFVGVLLVLFSVIFPTLKLIATTLFYYSKEKIANNKIIRFFALYSTKWSMADVMVVSIFMAYLGLDGVVESELKKLEKASDPVNIITSNGTHLEVGFFLFLGFVMTSFVLSVLVQKSRKQRLEKETLK